MWGALWRLVELGYLGSLEHIINDDDHDGVNAGTLEQISSVSGGAITAAVLAQNWHLLEVDKEGLPDRFIEYLVKPVRGLAEHTIDVKSVLAGILLPGSINKRLTGAYRKHLFQHATLQDMPDTPSFVLNSTNLQSGALWRFMKPYMADWKVGKILNPVVELAAAVAASSAFPPLLSPARFKFLTSQYEPDSGASLQYPPYTTNPILADGGVYDNLGLETAWKKYATIIVSDAGGQMQPEQQIGSNWISQFYRTFSVEDNQVRSLRKRQVVGSYINDDRYGVYWGIRSDIENFKIPETLDCPYEQTIKLANIATRLKKLDPVTQERLINWGYAVCDTGMRAHVDKNIEAATNFPYPDSGVGQKDT